MCLLVCVCLALAAAGARADDPPPKKSSLSAPDTEARLSDDSVLRLTLREETVTLQMKYGKLVVPLADIRRIDFATRVPDDVLQKIDALVNKLADNQEKVREEAAAELLRLKSAAYPALQKAAKGADANLAKRAEEVLEQLRTDVPEDELEPRSTDVLYVDEMRLAGRIEATTLKARTRAFGEVQLRLSELRSLRAAGEAAAEEAANANANVQPGPPNLNALANANGQKFTFRVTGAIGGNVWGTDIYTSDSTLAAAAVHAGVLKPGQTGLVRVQIITNHPGFVGSQRNGVASDGFGAMPGYKILKGRDAKP
jgi:hypothetical protein